MLLNQLVRVNEKANIANSVNFGMMKNTEKNHALCEGFVFNYDSQKPNTSTVGILDRLRLSYHSQSTPNIHLVVQQYGKGKSHFAVALANFFSQPPESPEVQGILEQIRVATTGQNNSLVEGLRAFKENRRYLTVCLSGDDGGDLRQHFLKQLLTTLDREGITDSIAHHICQEPLNYLQDLSEEDRRRADEYLHQQGHPDGDLNTMVHLLQEGNTSIIPAVKALSRYLVGYPIDFQTHIDIESILEDLIEGLCSGDTPRFQGILILFDELNYYLKAWANNSAAAGGTAIQNITNICETYRHKIALLSFAQVGLTKASGISGSERESYLKIASRLEPADSTYYPESSLELVINNLLEQRVDTEDWKGFFEHWGNTLLREAQQAFNTYIPIYRERGWSFDDFFKHLGVGSFPLHPLTGYLLSKLDFAQVQDRTAIQFVRGYVREFIESHPVEEDGLLSYVYPIDLVDVFLDNLSDAQYYNQFIKARDLVIHSENPDELSILKALFLHFTSGDKLTKSDRDPHENILSELSGLPPSRVREALKQLEARDQIYYRSDSKLYTFYSGSTTPGELRKKLEETVHRQPNSIKDVVVYCRQNLSSHLKSSSIMAKQFVSDNGLVGDDWTFDYQIYDSDEFHRILRSQRWSPVRGAKGVVGFVLAETLEDLQDIRQQTSHKLQNSGLENCLVVAVPKITTEELNHTLKLQKALRQLSEGEKTLYGNTFTQLAKQLNDQIEGETERLLTDCSYHNPLVDQLSPREQENLQLVVSALLRQTYPLVASVGNVDKLRSQHNTGRQIVRVIAEKLFQNKFTPSNLPHNQFYQTTIDNVFCKVWGIFRIERQKYQVHIPRNKRVKAAWDEISQATDISHCPSKTVALKQLWKTLSAPPYGYNELTFTVLLCSWLAYHRTEVVLKGTTAIPKRKSDSFPVVSQPLTDWGSSNLFEKIDNFINVWIVKQTAQLIRRQRLAPPELPDSSPIPYDEACAYLKQVEEFLGSSDIIKAEAEQVKRDRQPVAASVKDIDNWFAPIDHVQSLPQPLSLEQLIEHYPQVKTIPPAIRIDRISVSPSPKQRELHEQVKQRVQSQLEEQILSFSEEADRLNNEEACDAYQTRLAGLQEQLATIPDLERFGQTLNYASQRVESVRSQLQTRQQVADILQQINSQFAKLSETSSQADYDEVQTAIESLTAEAPPSQEIHDRVTETIQTLEQSRSQLLQQLQDWEQDAANPKTRQQILEMSKAIAREESRFTDPDSKTRLQHLQTQLDRKLLDAETQESSQQQQAEAEAARRQQIQQLAPSPNLPLAECESRLQQLQELRSQLQDNSLEPDFNRVQEQLDSQIQDYRQQLNQIGDRLDSLTTRSEFNQVKSNYDKLEVLLQHSSQWDPYQQHLPRFESLQQDIETIAAFEADKRRSHSSQDLNSLSDRLQQLPQQLHNPHRFQPQLEQWTNDLNQQRQTYQQQAQNWLNDLQQQFQQIYQTPDNSEKLAIVTQVRDRLQRERSQHDPNLTPEAQTTLSQLQQECQREQDKDTANQIKVLFQQLPRVQRQTLYEHLKAYLSHD
ncbi:MAG: Protein of unknown function (DUF3584) [Phormidium sp. OSCR]|nr:MAG: Protein of unknown function (DUF3584) [Phormidium sp. OSCR]